ncbi:MAG: hypothetical protein ACI3XP_07790 [Eubacteriales bacterium]
MYPLCVRAAESAVTPGDNSYTEYFPLRAPAADADVIVLGVDFSAEGTCELLEDLLTALKHECNIGSVFVELAPEAAQYAAAAVSAASQDELEAKLILLKEKGASEGLCLFLERLNAMNENYPPQRKLSGGVADESADGDPAEALIRSAAAEYRRSGRPALVITGTEMLCTGSSFLRAVQSMPERMLLVQFLYEGGTAASSDGAHSVFLVDSDRLALFDDLYAAAERKIGGSYPSESYTSGYSTEIFFVLRD